MRRFLFAFIRKTIWSLFLSAIISDTNTKSSRSLARRTEISLFRFILFHIKFIPLVITSVTRTAFQKLFADCKITIRAAWLPLTTLSTYLAYKTNEFHTSSRIYTLSRECISELQVLEKTHHTRFRIHYHRRKHKLTRKYIDPSTSIS